MSISKWQKVRGKCKLNYASHLQKSTFYIFLFLRLTHKDWFKRWTTHLPKKELIKKEKKETKEAFKRKSWELHSHNYSSTLRSISIRSEKIKHTKLSPSKPQEIKFTAYTKPKWNKHSNQDSAFKTYPHSTYTGSHHGL